MKKSYILLLALLALSFMSCDNDDNKDFINIDKSSITVNPSGGSDFVEIEASGEWTTENCPDWVTVQALYMSEDISTRVSVQATPHEGNEKRSANITFRCGKATKTLKVEQLSINDIDPFINIKESIIYMSVFGEQKNIKLLSNVSWVANNIPDWITLSSISGEGSTELLITAKSNNDPKKRDVEITFEGEGGTECKFKISQIGQEDIIRVPELYILHSGAMSFSISLDKIDVSTDNSFINSAIKNKVYLGNLVSHNAETNTSVSEFTGYTFNPITVSTSAIVNGDVAKTYIPSLTEQNTFAKYVMDNRASQGSAISSDSYTEYYNYKLLHAIGMVSLGVKLDEIITGHSYTEIEMTRKCGVIYAFKRTAFSLDIDTPEKLINEQLNATDAAKGVSYVSSISYGRIGLLVIESNYGADKVRNAVDKVISNRSLTAEETKIIQESDFFHIYFDNDKNLQMEHGTADVINAYKAKMKRTITDNWYPITFSVTDFAEHTANKISYSVKLGE